MWEEQREETRCRTGLRDTMADVLLGEKVTAVEIDGMQQDLGKER